MSHIQEFITPVSGIAEQADEPAIKKTSVKRLFGAYVAKARIHYPNERDMGGPGSPMHWRSL